MQFRQKIRYLFRKISDLLRIICPLILTLAGIFIIWKYSTVHPLMPVVGLCLFAVGLFTFMTLISPISCHIPLIPTFAGIFIILNYSTVDHSPLMPVVGLCLFAVGLFTFMTLISPISWHIPFLLIVFLGLMFALWYNPHNKTIEELKAKVKKLEIKNKQSSQNNEKLEKISINICTSNSQIGELKAKVEESEIKSKQSSQNNEKLEKIPSDISTSNSQREESKAKVEKSEIKSKQSSQNVPTAKPPTSSPTANPSDDKPWTKGEFIITFIGFLITIVSFTFGKKIEKLFEMETRLDEATRLTISSAEIALANLPDFTESHQISYNSYKILKTVDGIIFHHQSHILKFLDKIGKGAKLRFARAVKLFADGEYKGAIDGLEDIARNQKTDQDTYRQALYRLGITYRQIGEYVESVNTFYELYKYGDYLDKIKAEYGIALTLYAISKASRFVADSDKEKINKVLNSICPSKVNITDDCKKLAEKLNSNEKNGDDKNKKNEELNSNMKNGGYKTVAEKLINEVLKKHPFHFSAILFSVLIPANGDSKLPIKASGDEQKKRLRILLRFLKQVIPESLNIRANYFVVEALVYYSLNKIEEAKKALACACYTTKLYINIAPQNHTIFSDIQVKQIPAEDFLEEIEEIKEAIK